MPHNMQGTNKATPESGRLFRHPCGVNVNRRHIALLLALSALVLLAGCISAKDRNDGKVHHTLGLSYLREPNYSLALKEFLQAEQANPDDPNIHLSLAQTYQLMRSYPEAEKSYKRALSLADKSLEPICQNNLGALYLDMQRWDDAIRAFSQAKENLLFQTPEVSHTGIGFALFKKGDFLSAIGAYKRALEINPNYSTAHLRLAEAYEAFGKPDLALNEYQEVVKIAPDNASVQYQLGLSSARAGKKAQAIKAFRDVIRIAPESEEAKLSLDNIKLLQ